MEDKKQTTTNDIFTNDKYWWDYALDLDSRKREYRKDHPEIEEQTSTGEKIPEAEIELQFLRKFENRNDSLSDFIIQQGIESFNPKEYPSYREYIQPDALLNAQIPLSKNPEERIFVIAHQMYEMVFKQMIFDFEIVSHTLDNLYTSNDFERLLNINISEKYYDYNQVEQDKEFINFWQPSVFAANRLVFNSTQMLKYLSGYFSKENFSGYEFTQFRPLLLPASGFQTEQFRTIQQTLGKKPLMNYRIFASHEYLKKYYPPKFSKKEDADTAYIAENYPERINNFTNVINQKIYDKPNEEAVRIRNWEENEKGFKNRQKWLTTIVENILTKVASTFKGNDVPYIQYEVQNTSSVLVEFENYITNLSAFGKENIDIETEQKIKKTIEELIGELRYQLQNDINAQNNAEEPRRGALILSKNFSHTALHHIFKQLLKVDNALHNRYSSFLKGHLEMIREQIMIVLKLDKSNGDTSLPGTGGGGFDYLNFMLELYPLFPAFPAMKGVIK